MGKPQWNFNIVSCLKRGRLVTGQITVLAALLLCDGCFADRRMTESEHTSMRPAADLAQPSQRAVQRRLRTRKRKRKARMISTRKKRRSAMVRAMRSFQKASPVRLDNRRQRTDLPKVRRRLWRNLLDRSGAWAGSAKGRKDRVLAAQLADWLDDQRRLESRRYALPQVFILRIDEMTRFCRARSGGAPTLVRIAIPTLRWPLAKVVVTSFFGTRADPFGPGRKLHHGVDLAAEVGAPVRSVAAGTVRHAAPMGSYGNLVIIDHGNDLSSRYAHLNGISVRSGNQIAAGAVIGSAGQTGRVTGPHLHLEIRKGDRPIDPLRLAGWVIGGP
jgi:murein DD-endopeptidase MepM/ murein hydrolase activator NlpD